MNYNKNQSMVLTGEPTPQAVIYKNESHKLNQAFPVKSGKTIIQGQPVKLNTDGTIEAYIGEGQYLGIATTNSENTATTENATDIEVTVMVSGYAIVYGLSNGTITAGPVVPAGEPESDKQYVKYKQGTDDKFLALNTADAADELIQILIR